MGNAGFILSTLELRFEWPGGGPGLRGLLGALPGKFLRRAPALWRKRE